MFTLTLYTMMGLLLILVIGFFLSKNDVINDEVSEKFTYILTNIIVPCNVFMALQVDVSAVSTKNMLIALLMDTVFFVSVIIISLVICRLLKMPDEKDGVIVCTLAFGNVSFIAFPLLANIIGEDTSFYVALGQIPFNVLFFTIGIYLISKDSNKEKFSLKSLLTPNLIAIFAGLVCFFLQIQLHKAISVGVELLAKMSAPISLFILGKFLSDMNIEEAFEDKEVYIITAIKLFLIPYIFLSIFKDISDDNLLLASSLTLYAMPTVTLVPIFAKRYGADYELASKVVFLTTVVSLLSTPMFVYLMEYTINF
ncbi:MAG: AEC family transporter [Lachnospirales bacterium]